MKRKLLVLNIMLILVLSSSLYAGYVIEPNNVFPSNLPSKDEMRVEQLITKKQTRAMKKQLLLAKRAEKKRIWQQIVEARQFNKMRYATKKSEQKKLMKRIKKQGMAQLLVMNMQRAMEDKQLRKLQHEAKKSERKASRIARRNRERAKRVEHAKQREQENPRWAFLYKIPSWDFPALPFKKSDLACVTGRYQYAGKSYSSSDHTQDITKLVFGEAPIRVQDILLVSKLVRGGKLWPIGTATLAEAQGHYLYLLANERISFDGKMEEWRGSFDFARHFTKELSFGFQIPFASRRHELKLQTNLSETAKEAISGDADYPNFAFPGKYNHSFTAFIEDILAEKNIKLHPKNTNTGIGDITAFVNWDIPTKHVEKLMFGVKVLFPTARDRDLHKLWDAELGNGGFTELSPYCAFVYAHNKFFNPHFYGQITYGVSAYVDRRVPRLRTYDSSAAGDQTLSDLTSPAGMEGIVFANRVKTIPPNAEAGHSVSFNEVDTIFRRFSTETLRIKIYPGPEINLRIGNMLEKVFVKRMFADFYYDFYAKGKDHIGARLDTSKWDGTVLKKNSYQIAHKLGVNLSYQFDKNVRGELGGKYTFIGRNVPEIWEANGAVRLDF